LIGLPHGPRIVASIATRRYVIKIQSKLRPIVNRNHVIGVKMPFAAKLTAAQLVQHAIGRRIA
jgi:hypothetical protein